MKFSNDPEAGRRGEFEKQVKHGWYLGSEVFMKKLDSYLKDQTKNDNFRGVQKKDHDEAEAERLLQKGLKSLKLTEDELLSSKSVRIEKQAIVWLLKSYTTVRVVWIAERLQMGHPVNASRAISRFKQEPDKETRLLKKEMIRCVG